MSRIAVMAWRNLFRHGRRTLITALAMAIGVALALGGLSWSDGAYSDMRRVMIDESVGHVQVHHVDFPATQDLYDVIPGGEERLAQLAALPGVAGVSGRVYGHALIGGAEKSTGGLLVGVLPARERALANLQERIVVGAYLDDDAAGGILLGRGLAKHLGLGVGDEVVAVTQAADGSIGNALFTVVGLVVSGSTQLDRAGAYLHLADVQALLALDHGLHEIRLLTAGSQDRERIDAVAAEVRAALGDGEVVVRPWWVVQPQLGQMMDLQSAGSAIILGIIFVLVAIGILNTMLMSVFERTRELGVLKAIGMRPRQIVLLVVAESVSLAGLSAGLGLVLGSGLMAYLVVYGIDMRGPTGEGFSAMGVTFDVLRAEVDPGSVALVVVTCIVVAILAALWPALRAARLEPVAAMREE